MGEKIREIRLRRGITLTELAERTGVTRQQLSKIENGHVQNMTILTAKAIADALFCEIADFVY